MQANLSSEHAFAKIVNSLNHKVVETTISQCTIVLSLCVMLISAYNGMISILAFVVVCTSIALTYSKSSVIARNYYTAILSIASLLLAFFVLHNTANFVKDLHSGYKNMYYAMCNIVAGALFALALINFAWHYVLNAILTDQTCIDYAISELANQIKTIKRDDPTRA